MDAFHQPALPGVAAIPGQKPAGQGGLRPRGPVLPGRQRRPEGPEHAGLTQGCTRASSPAHRVGVPGRASRAPRGTGSASANVHPTCHSTQPTSCSAPPPPPPRPVEFLGQCAYLVPESRAPYHPSAVLRCTMHPPQGRVRMGPRAHTHACTHQPHPPSGSRSVFCSRQHQVRLPSKLPWAVYWTKLTCLPFAPPIASSLSLSPSHSPFQAFLAAARPSSRNLNEL